MEGNPRNNKLAVLFSAFIFLLIGFTLVFPINGRRTDNHSNENVEVQPIFEQTKIILGENKSPVKQICYEAETNKLYVIEGHGMLDIWDMKSGQKIQEYALGVISLTGQIFSKNCNRVIGATQEELRYKRNYYDGIKIWDTTTGEEIRCFSSQCKGESLHPGEIGATINSDGDIVILYSENSLIRFDMKHSNSVVQSIRGMDDSSPTIGHISFSPENNSYAVAYLEGKIDYFKPIPILNFSIFPKVYQDEKSPKEPQPIYSLSFDQTGKTIGSIRGNTLKVWKIDGLSEEIILEKNVDGQKILSFDKTNKFVLVAGNDNISIWNIYEKKKVRELVTLGITSLVISEDNKHLIWGDELGEVHIMQEKLNN
jgi:hypothetical protein